MTQPRWMQGTPVEQEKKPRWMQGEVISEGGPESFGSVRDAVDALPAFLTRTAEEKTADKVAADQRAAAEMFRPTSPMEKAAGAFSGQYLNSSTFGQGDNLNAAIDTLLNINTMGDDFSSRKDGYRSARGQMREESPIASLIGELGGYLAPGAAAWKGLSSIGKAIPGVAQAGNAAQSAGRLPAYLSRLLGSSALFTADTALYGATVGASNEAAATGKDPTLGDRARVAKDMALANVGDVAESTGTNVPDFLKPIPIAPAMPVIGSGVERLTKGLVSGGKMVTPDRVQAEVLENVGRAPSPNSTASAMAEVIPGERITSGTVKTFRFIENALRNGLKDAGLSSAEITSRVTRGFNSIHKSIPALADGSTTLAQLIEREFADAGPQVSENLRLFLLRVGLDDPAVTRGVIQEMRTGQVEDFRQVVNENLGSQRQYDVEQGLKQGLKKIGETYDQILSKAKELGNNSPLANSMREQLSESRFKFELTEEASKRGWKDVDAFIQNDPWQAAHKLKSKLLGSARDAKQSGNYEKYQEPAVYLREMLNELPGYQDLSKRFALESNVLDTLGHVDTLPNGNKVVTEGFGPKLRKGANKETEVLRAADEFAAMPDRQQQAAQISTGQVLKDQLRTARPGGTDLQGQDVMGLRLFDLQNEGMMSTNADMPGAIPTVFGEAGERISSKVDDIVNSRKFLADIDPNTGSNTVNKANAQMAGDAVVTSGLPRTMTSGYTQAGLIDATMFASGLPPIATMLTKGIPAIGKVLGPSRGTRAEIAKALMQRPARRGAPPEGPDEIAGLTGRNRPRKWRNDPKWSDPNLTNPQLPGGPVAENSFIPEGNTFPMVAAGYGAINPQDVPGTSEGIDWQDRLAYSAILGGGAKFIQKADDMLPPPGGPTASNGIDGRRRKDVMREAMSKSQGAPVEGITQPSRRADPTLNAPIEPRDEGGSGLLTKILAGAGSAGAAAYGIDQLIQPEATTVEPTPAEPQSFGPSVKPDLSSVQAQISEKANLNAREQDQSQRQMYWEFLKSKGDGSSIEWNQIHEERARELTLTPDDIARGVTRKRLPYLYDAPVSALRTAPVEELINGEWVVPEAAR